MNRLIESLFEDLQYLESIARRTSCDNGLSLSREASLQELIDQKIIALTGE